MKSVITPEGFLRSVLRAGLPLATDLRGGGRGNIRAEDIFENGLSDARAFEVHAGAMIRV